MFDDYYYLMESTGAELHELHESHRWEMMQKWREVFAKPYHRETGNWKHGQFEWHMFSFEHTRSIHGEKAVRQYQDLTAERFLVVPENEVIAAYSCTGGWMPHLHIFALDIYVWPEDLSWTMAYTHEVDSGIGPYFCRRDWIE